MDAPTLTVHDAGKVVTATLNRPERQNALNARMVEELHALLTRLEAAPEVRILVLAGSPQAFCTGMDFAEASAGGMTETGDPGDARGRVEAVVGRFYALMERFTRTPKVVVAKVEGPVNAGGMGLVGAADHVIATPSASFGLSEALFGLVPATVAPFLVRRTGFQPTYRLSLTAQRIDAARALAINLVDEVADDPDDAVRRLLLRVDRIREETVTALKAYFTGLSGIGPDTGPRAVDAIATRIADPGTMEGIRGFVAGEGVPWRRP